MMIVVCLRRPARAVDPGLPLADTPGPLCANDSTSPRADVRPVDDPGPLQRTARADVGLPAGPEDLPEPDED